MTENDFSDIYGRRTALGLTAVGIGSLAGCVDMLIDSTPDEDDETTASDDGGNDSSVRDEDGDPADNESNVEEHPEPDDSTDETEPTPVDDGPGSEDHPEPNDSTDETGPESDPEPDPEPDPESDPGSNPEPDPEPDPGSDPEPEPEPDPIDDGDDGDEKDDGGDDDDNGDDPEPEPDPDPDPDPDPESNGLLVFTYDDSPIEDYTKSFPIHEEYGVPGCIAVNPALMASPGTLWLPPEYAREMQEAGWGIMGHTYRHRSFGEIRLARPVSAGDEKVYVERNTHGRFVDDPLVVTDGESRVEASVADRGSDDAGQYVVLQDPISVDVSGDGVVHHPKPFLREKLEKTDEQLHYWDLDVFGFAYPYDRYHGVAEEVVRDHYDAVANHRWSRGLNDVSTDPSKWRRQYIQTHNVDEATIESFLDDAVERDVVAIVGGHSQWDTLPESRIRFVIEEALDRDLEIVTMKEAVERTAVHREPVASTRPF